MRQAEINRRWEKALSSEGSTKLRHLELLDIPGFDNETISLGAGLHLVCGRNGSGKSTLLSLVRICLLGRQEHDSWLVEKFQSGQVALAVKWRDLELKLSYDFSSDEHSINCIDPGSGHSDPSAFDAEVLMVQTAADSPALQKYYRTEIPDILEPYEPADATKSGLKEYAALIGKPYGRMEIFELDGFDGDGEIPYFRVTIGSLTYGSESMGMGELSLLHLRWVLDRIPKSSILLIEEPEAFVAPIALRRSLDHIASACADRSLTCIITTHSPIALQCMPISNTTVLATGASGNAMCLTGDDIGIAFHQLGLNISKDKVLFVEDVVAREVLRAILILFSGELQYQSETVCVGGQDEIVKLLSAIPKLQHIWFSGVLDGDGVIPGELKGWPIVKLPGASAPEVEFQRMLNQADLTSVASTLGVASTELNIALGSAASLDHHDWLHSLAHSLGIPVGSLTGRLASMWVDENAEACEAFLKELEAATYSAEP